MREFNLEKAKAENKTNQFIEELHVLLKKFDAVISFERYEESSFFTVDSVDLYLREDFKSKIRIEGSYLDKNNLIYTMI